MPIFKYFTVVGSALLVLLFIADAYLSDSGSRFNAAMYDSTTYAPSMAETVAVPPIRLTQDVSPADRVRDAFAQFGANDRRRKSKI